MNTNNTTNPLESRHETTVEQLIETVTAPYTPSQRTALVTDILCHLQEERKAAREPLTDEEWNDTHSSAKHASDEKLDSLWEAVAEWIGTREDTPTDTDDEVVEHLVDVGNLDPGDATIYYQRYKRFTDGEQADYGFLGGQIYHHETDSPENSV